jgi:hypothetical protein
VYLQSVLDPDPESRFVLLHISFAALMTFLTCLRPCPLSRANSDFSLIFRRRAKAKYFESSISGNEFCSYALHAARLIDELPISNKAYTEQMPMEIAIRKHIVDRNEERCL